MNILSIETVSLVDPRKASATIVRVHTDEGVTGIGQAQAPSLVIDAIIKSNGGLEKLIVGEDPLQVQRLWQRMYASTSLYGRRGVVMLAIGAVETALWDIAGKALGRPVCELIWGSCCSIRDRGEIKAKVTPYCTAYGVGDPGDIGPLRERFGLAVEKGFRAIKMEAWPTGFAYGSVKRDVEAVRMVREIIGDERELMIDVENRWTDAGRAVMTIRAIEPFRVFFVEAPLPPDNLEGYARLADTVDTRIGAGDWGFTTRFEFEELMVRGRVDVVQPSSVQAGGMSEIVRIAEMAYRRGLLCVPHAWYHMVGVAAEIHLAAVLPNMPYYEMPLVYPGFDSPIFADLLVPSPFPDKDGYVEVPKRPGLGFELNEEVVKKYRVPPQ